VFTCLHVSEGIQVVHRLCESTVALVPIVACISKVTVVRTNDKPEVYQLIQQQFDPVKPAIPHRRGLPYSW
jgi:hypothetical protein